MQQAKEESLYYESGNFRLQALDDGEAVEVEVERLMGFSAISSRTAPRLMKRESVR